MVMLEFESPSGTLITSNHASYDNYAPEGPLNTAAGEQSMWRAVIVQALMDASSLSKKPENMQYRKDALIWLRGTSEDFHRVCHYAGFDPSCAKHMIKAALEKGCQWRIAPGTGERGVRSKEQGGRCRPTAQR